MSTAYPPYPGPVWQREGYANERDYLDDAYRQLCGHKPPPLPATRTRQIARLELPGITLTLDQRQVTEPDGQGQVLNSGSQFDKSWIFEASLRQPRMLNGLLRKILGPRVDHVGHKSSPSVECGAPTVGETAAPDGLLRDSSGAANQGGAR